MYFKSKSVKGSSVVFVLISCTLVVTAQGPNPQSSESAKEKIRQEIQSLTNHPWAGRYYEGDNLGSKRSFIIAPEQGFVFEWGGCLGLYDRKHGAVSETQGLIHLTFALPNQREEHVGIANDLYVVRWGNRRYLIPTNDMIGFCNSINSGDEPRTRIEGNHLLQIGDEQKEVSGFPPIPNVYKPYLLKQPITVELKEILNITTNSNPQSYYYLDRKTSAAVDLDAQQLLQPGMQLYLINRERVFATTFVSEVSSNTAKLTIETSKIFPLPQVGWRFSTSPRWRLANKP